MSCWTFLEGDQNWSETQWKGLFPLCSTKEASRRARNKLLLQSFVFVCWVAERFELRKVFASCSYGGQSKFMLAANFSLIFIINIIHVAEDPLLSPLQQPRIALIKILINYIFQSVIIFQMWILMNFASSLPPPPLAVRHHWQAPQNITNSTSESLPSNILGWKKKVTFLLCVCSGEFLLAPEDFHQIGLMLGRASSEASRHSEYSAGCTNFWPEGTCAACASERVLRLWARQPEILLVGLFSPHRCCKHSAVFFSLCFLWMKQQNPAEMIQF